MSFERLFNARQRPKVEPANECTHPTAKLEYIGPVADALNMITGLEYRCECGAKIIR